jgi:hypothetical protein
MYRERRYLVGGSDPFTKEGSSCQGREGEYVGTERKNRDLLTDGLHSGAKYEPSAVYEHKAYVTACDPCR